MTPFICDETLEIILDKSGNSELPIVLFENNFMKLKSDKVHLLVSETKYEYSWTKLGDDKIWEVTS